MACSGIPAGLVFPSFARQALLLTTIRLIFPNSTPRADCRIFARGDPPRTAVGALSCGCFIAERTSSALVTNTRLRRSVKASSACLAECGGFGCFLARRAVLAKLTLRKSTNSARVAYEAFYGSLRRVLSCITNATIHILAICIVTPPTNGAV